MSSRLIIDGNAVYEIDEDCIRNGEQRSSRKSRDYTPVKKQNEEEDRKRER